MPLRDFKCRLCGVVTEQLTSSTRPAETVCETCGAPDGLEEVRGVVGRTKLKFKGKGWTPKFGEFK